MAIDPIEASNGSEDAASRFEKYPDIVLAEKKQFVRKLGDLLSLTNAGIYHCELLSQSEDKEYVVVFYFGGTQRAIDISGNDYLDIIKDTSTYCRKEGHNGSKQD